MNEKHFEVNEHKAAISYPARVDETELLGKIVAARLTGTKEQLDATAIMYEKEWPSETYGTQAYGDATVCGASFSDWGDPAGPVIEVYTVIIVRNK